MASTIVTKNSSTASAVPVAGDLTKGELAVNVTDKKLYTKDNGGSVVKLVGGLGNQEANAVAITGGAIDGTTVGSTTTAAGAFTTLAASSTVSGTGFSNYLASPPAIGGTAAAAGSFTTLAASGNFSLSGGTANGVLYLNGSKVATSGSALTFDGTNLGIGTSSPLSVSGYTFVDLLGSTGAQYRVRTASTDLRVGSDASVAFVNSTNTSLWFGANNTEGMRLTSTGLGIGTSSPGAKLEVSNGNILLSNAYYLSSRNAANTTTISLIGRNSSDQVVIDADGYGLKMGASGALFLNSSGNLGLGVTPSAWGSGHRALDIGSNSYVSGSTSMTVENNVYFNGTNNIYKNTAAATQYQQTNAGTHTWSIAPSGTAGNAISFTQAMTLDSSGNLLVGTTSPSITNSKSVFQQDTTNYWSAALISDNRGLIVRQSNASGGIAAYFEVNSGTNVGSINTTSSATSYATSSDYRLKENQQPLTGSGAFIDALKPKTWNWKVDGSVGVGFIAHEVQEVSPGSVVGEKDGEQMQAMEYGSAEFIANIIAELQSLRARVAALES